MRAVFLAILALTGCDRGHPQDQAVPAPATTSKPAATPTFIDIRATYRTKLVKHGPSPQPYENEPPPTGVEKVTYPSADLQLAAWYAHPASDRPVPALIYLHGGFAFSADDFEVTRPFLNAGFAVMTPMLRGENGNPGEFELYYGELDDARAAVRWVRARPEIDPKHLYVFGHSAGGVLAAMLAFYPVNGVRLTGSSGGLYGTDSFNGLEPFDPTDALEKALRAPALNADQFLIAHVGFIGIDDASVQESAEMARDLSERGHRLLRVVRVEGDHQSSLAPSLQRFLGLARVSATSKEP